MLCEYMGIIHQLTVSYTLNKTEFLREKQKTWRWQPKSCWDNVFPTMFLLNRLPTSVVHEETPIEAWMGMKPTT